MLDAQPPGRSLLARRGGSQAGRGPVPPRDYPSPPNAGKKSLVALGNPSGTPLRMPRRSRSSDPELALGEPMPSGPAGGGAPASRRSLVVGPPASGKTTALLDRFLAALRTHGADGVLLVLPTYGEVEHAKRMLVARRDPERRLDGVLDAALATFTSLGERLDPKWRVAHLPTRLERDLWAGAALESVPALATASRQPGMRSRFLRLVKELKQTGDAPASARARARAAGTALDGPAVDRLHAFVDAWEAYDARLAAGGARDHEDALRALVDAVRGPARDAVARIRFLAVDGFEDLTGVQSRLLDALVDVVAGAGGECVVTLPFDAARADLFAPARRLAARLESRGFARTTLAGFRRSEAPALRALATRLFADEGGGAPASREPVEPGTALRTIVGVDPTDEWDRIGREIRRLVRDETGVVAGFKDVAVVVRRLDAGVAGSGAVDAKRALERLGVPVRIVGGGARLASEPVVRALRGPLRVLAGEDGHDGRPFEPALLLDYLRWRALASGKPVSVEAVDRAEIAWRESGPPVDMAAFVAAFRDGGRPYQEVFRDLALVTGVVLEGARAGSSGGPWRRLRIAVELLLPLPSSSGLAEDGRPLDLEHDAALARAAAAKSSLLRLCAEAEEAVERTGVGGEASAADAVRDLYDAAADAVSSPPDRRLDAVSILDAEEARHWEAPVVFVAGLVDKAFPLLPREDVFVRDDDRLALRERMYGDAADPAAGAWRTAREAEDGERRLFLWAVTRATERVYLARHVLDEGGRAAAPSPFLREADAALGLVGEGGAEHPLSLSRSAPDLARRCVLPPEALSEDDLLRFVADRLSPGSLAAEDGAADRRLARALLAAGGDVPGRLTARALRFRRAEEDVLPATAAVLSAFANATRTLSPKWLTAGRSCLHRFFLGQGVDPLVL